MDYNQIESIPELFSQEENCIHSGRNVVKRIVLPNGEAVIAKRFKKPSLIQRISNIWRGTKAQRAYTNARRLMTLGFVTPKPAGILKDSKGFSYLITEEDTGEPICNVLHNDDIRKEFSKAFAHYTFMLHKAGIIHKDYNNTNVRFKRAGTSYTFSLIDINRMAFYSSVPPLKVRLKNLFLFSSFDETFKEVLKQYLVETGIYSSQLYDEVLIQKQKHDKHWEQKKAFWKRMKNLF